MNRLIRIGTRGSKLALWQANWTKSFLEANFPSIPIELNIIKTQGDKILDVPLAKVGGKGLFVKEIEQALLTRRIDIAVHSMKDMPSDIPQGLCIGAIPERENPVDVFISRSGMSFKELPAGSVIGTSSLRRGAQLRHNRADIVIQPVRGNLNTRLKKLETENFDALVLAAAGVPESGAYDAAALALITDAVARVGSHTEEITSELKNLLDRLPIVRFPRLLELVAQGRARIKDLAILFVVAVAERAGEQVRHGLAQQLRLDLGCAAQQVQQGGGRLGDHPALGPVEPRQHEAVDLPEDEGQHHEDTGDARQLGLVQRQRLVQHRQQAQRHVQLVGQLDEVPQRRNRQGAGIVEQEGELRLDSLELEAHGRGLRRAGCADYRIARRSSPHAPPHHPPHRHRS